MKLLVNKNKVILDEKDKLNAGEYNIHQVEFVFSEEYNGLVKKATFSTKEHSYLVDLPSNTCIIPYEVLEETGDFEIGAFGYETNGDELVLRYSPSPTYVYVDLGSYRDSFDNYKVPTADVIEQLTERIEQAEQTVEGYDDRLTTAENKLATVEEGAEVNLIEDIKVNNTSLEITDKSVNIPIPTKTSDLNNDSGYITNTVDNLTNYTKTGDMNTAINNAVNGEKELRQQADTNLQTQIDAITSSTDVVDVIGTYQELLDYDTSKLTDKDVIKVLQDSTHNNALSYFRWIINTTSSWNYIGSEGPFYTKGETDTLLNTKQDTIDSSHKLSADYVDDSLTTNKFVTTSDKTSWNNKYDKPNTGIPKTDLSSSVQTSLNKADTAIQDVSNKEDKSNKVTSVSSSSTDIQYPSAKLLYEEKTALEVENNKLKGVINNIYDLENYLFEEQSTHQETDQVITLNNTMKNAPMKTILKGNTSQTGTPTPDSPIPINVVSGDNTITISNSDNTQSQTYHITLPNGMELCNIPNTDYQDYFTKNSEGQWCKYNAIGKVVLDGSESWSYVSLNAFFLTTFSNAKKSVANLDIIVLSDNFKGEKATYATNPDYDNIICINTNGYTLLRDSAFTSASDFKTWLSTHNTTTYYVLETPYLSLIEDTTLINQLDNIQNALSYEGQTNVSQVNNDKPIIIDITAIQKL